MKKYIIFLLLLLTLPCTSVTVGTVGSATSLNCCYREDERHSILLARKEICCVCGKKEARSHSYMSTRPINQHLNIDQFLLPFILYDKKGDNRSGFAFSTIYQESIVTEDTKRYFLPTCHTTLLVSGDCNTEDTAVRDVRAEWLGLDKNFRGRFTIAPKQKQFAFVMEYNKDLDQYIKSYFLDGLWFNLRAPLAFVENDMNLQQLDVVNPSPTFPHDIIEAFKQRAWDYGRICNKQSNIRLAELVVQIGRSFLWDEYFLLSYYTGVRFPTGNKQEALFMFDPVVGNNNHLGIEGGVNFQLLLNRDPRDYAYLWFANLEDTFFIRRHEKRIFDLKCKPWSRYLLLTHKDGPLGNTVPGVNVLTREVLVRPYDSIDFSTGLRVQTERMQFEASYNLWAHGDERVRLRCPFNDDYGIAGSITQLTCPTFDGVIPPPPAPGVHAVTASRSTISMQAANDTIPVRQPDGSFIEESVFVPIRWTDLDIHSAEAQSTLNHEAAVSIAFIHNGIRMNGYFGVGVFFDFPQKNAALKSAGGWAKFGATF